VPIQYREAVFQSLHSIHHPRVRATHRLIAARFCWPQIGRLVERFHMRLKDASRSQAAAAHWHDHLPWVMLVIRASFREDSEFSPAEAVFSSQLILPGQFINTAESQSPSFLNDLQTTMVGRRRSGTTRNQLHRHYRGFASGLLHSGPPGRRAAAVVPNL
jgi:hypothetical protein